MTRHLGVLLILAATLPVAVTVPRDSTSPPTTDQPGLRVQVAAGDGDYDVLQVLSGCGVPPTTYQSHVAHTDVSGQVEYETRSGGYVAGVRGGSLNERQGTVYQDGVAQSGSAAERTLVYVNPYLAMEKRTIGLGLGPMFSDHEFIVPQEGTRRIPWSGHFRLGPRDRLYIGLRYMEAVPLVSGGAYGQGGIGFGNPRFGQAWIGFGWVGPADLNTVELRGDVRLTRSLSLLGGGYWGSADKGDGHDVHASGWHAGLEWRRAGAPRDSTRGAP